MGSNAVSLCVQPQKPCQPCQARLGSSNGILDWHVNSMSNGWDDLMSSVCQLCWQTLPLTQVWIKAQPKATWGDHA